MNVRRVHKQLERLAEEIGLNTVTRSAQTGTIYLTVYNSRGNSMLIRIANHQDVYSRADYTCDNIEGSLAGARDQLIALRETTPSAIRRLRRIRRSKAERERVADRQRWIDGIVARGDETREEAERQADILFQRR